MPQIQDLSWDESAIDGLLVMGMKQVTDERGTVREFFRASSYQELIDAPVWQQINVTFSGYGALRGLHGEAMTKLVACVSGEVFGAYLDARAGSPSYGAVVTATLRPGLQVLVPAGVCNGFQCVSPEGSEYLYCFTAEWTPGMAGSAFHPLDEGLGIPWPLAVDTANPAQISAKDLRAPKFSLLAD